MDGRITVTLGLGAALLFATACGTANAVSPKAGTTRGAVAAATMTPAEMAAMGSPTFAPTPKTSAPAVTATPAQPTLAPAQLAAPAATTAPATNAAPAAAPAPAATAAPAGPASTVTVTLKDMAITLSTPSVSSGKVTFNVTNAGTTIHEFVVLQTSIAQNALTANVASPGTVIEPGFLGQVTNLAPQATGSLTLTLGAGSYVLICNEPAHYSALGMHTGFSVR